MRTIRTITLLACIAGAAAAAPSITAVQNAASNIPAGLPNSGIAQGSMFIIKGADLGPATFVVASTFPLETSIAGTSVQVTVSGTAVAGIMYYSGATQVAVILPSATPLGEGTLTVTYNGATSPPFPITVVQNAFGVFTVSQSGSGDAIAFLGPELVTPTNAANPGDVVSFWGTGLTPVDFDETMAAQQFDMTDVPIEAYVGARPANIVFRGRNACCSSVDVAYVEMPPGVSGCATPVTFKIGNTVSNTTTIAVAENGRTCTPSDPAFADVGNFDTWFSSGTFASGGVTLQRAVSVSPPMTAGGVTVAGNTSRTDALAASFFRLDVPPGGAGLGSAFDIASFGACVVRSYSGQIPPGVTFTPLDAGPQIAVSGTGGSWNMPRETLPGSIYYSELVDQTGTTFTPGTYNISGPGGADVGSFSVDLDVPEALVWTNQQQILEVDRSQGVTVTWTGGDPGGYVAIQGYSFVTTDPNDPSKVASTSFDCTARTTDQTFTVQPAVLLALPPSSTRNINGIEFPALGTLQVNSFTLKTFQATGLNYGAATHVISNGNGVTYR